MISRVHQFLFLFLFLISGVFTSFSQSCDINIVRQTFFQASYNYVSFLELKTLIGDNTIQNIEQQQAYSAAFEVLSAKYEKNIIDKIELVYGGLNHLNELIKQQKDEVEFRFLRFALEYHIPSLLMVSKHQMEDKNYMLENSQKIKQMEMSDSFKEELLSFIDGTGYFSEKEKNVLRENIFE